MDIEDLKNDIELKMNIGADVWYNNQTGELIILTYDQVVQQDINNLLEAYEHVDYMIDVTPDRELEITVYGMTLWIED